MLADFQPRPIRRSSCTLSTLAQEHLIHCKHTAGIRTLFVVLVCDPMVKGFGAVVTTVLSTYTHSTRPSLNALCPATRRSSIVSPPSRMVLARSALARMERCVCGLVSYILQQRLTVRHRTCANDCSSINVIVVFRRCSYPQGVQLLHCFGVRRYDHSIFYY